ncbi:transcriptional regulator [Streptomyces sp. C11-1]|uniref:Transcriptional regulator n=1 Tax=Streptomyces durocortorensis TaxID=2811104 RepID=A0ABY9W6X5_9ACTN|nr:MULTISPECIES: transcriptional regulator [Streptomyces]WNF29086.1 transcriptional regulator [Streptomyces durocortorensis]
MSEDGQHRQALTTLMHSPVRLAVLGTLRRVHNASFADLCEALDLDSPELSRQLRVLEEAGVVELAKLRGEGRRVRTFVRLSDEGRERFEEYLAHLRALVGES